MDSEFVVKVSAFHIKYCVFQPYSGHNHVSSYSTSSNQFRIEEAPSYVCLLSIFQYLLSIKPILEDEKYQRLSTLAEEFRTGLGKKLQRYLLLKSWWSTNYVSYYLVFLCTLSKKRGYIVLLMLVGRSVGLSVGWLVGRSVDQMVSADYLKYHLSQSLHILHVGWS